MALRWPQLRGAGRTPRLDRRKDSAWRRWAVAGVILLLLAGLRFTTPWQQVEGRSFDLLSTIAQPVPEQPGAVVVAIDEPSFSALQRQWPWPRDIHAKLIEALRAEGAKVIGFDVVFGEPGQGDGELASAAGPDTVFAIDESLIETPQASSLIRTEPLPEFTAFGAQAGVASVHMDGDGVLRQMPSYPDSLPRMIARVSGAKPAEPDNSRPRLIQYFGPANSYPRVSYYQALEPRKYLPPEIGRAHV